MSANHKFEVEAELRQDVGKGASRRLRHANLVPAVVYGAGEEPVSLTLDHNKTLHALSNEAFYSHILTLKIKGKHEKVILKSMQRHPAKPRILHMDFLRVRADQKLQMHVPLHFIGEDVAPGLKEGGVISHLISDLEVSCLPADLPEFIELDISQLQLNQTLHLSDLPLPKGVELVALAHGIEEHDRPIVSMHVPRQIEEVVVAPEAAVEGEASEQAASGESEPAKTKE